MNRSFSCRLLREVQEKSFAAHDLLLYLDTHPDSAEAWQAYREAAEARARAVLAYEQQVTALTPDGLLRRDDFDWADGPFPWQ